MEPFIESEQEITRACQNLINALKASLFEYKESRPNLSWRSVAKNIRCNRYILNKILTDDGVISSNKTYDMFECFRIASILTQKETSQALGIHNATRELLTALSQVAGQEQFQQAETA